MVYVDEYESKAIVDAPPVQAPAEIQSQAPGLKESAFKTFWHLLGVTIAENFENIKQALSKHRMEIQTPEQAINAMVGLWGTEKWVPVLKDVAPVIENTAEVKLAEIKPQESNFAVAGIAALIGAIGAVGSGALGLAGGAKGLKASKENAKATTTAAVAAVLLEKERKKTELAIAKAKERNILIISLVVIVSLILIFLGIMIYKRNKPKTA